MPYKDPTRMAAYMRERRAAKKENKVNVNPVNRKPVNPIETKKRFLLSYSRNKYQYTLYRISDDGKKMLIKSCKKYEKIMFGNAEVELTWGPEKKENGGN